MEFVYMVIGGWEWVIIIVVVVLLLFGGGEKIPELARGIGKAKGEIERGKRQIEKEIREAEMEASKSKEEKNETKEESESDQSLRAAAETLGFDPEGKSESEIKEEIKQTLEES